MAEWRCDECGLDYGTLDGATMASIAAAHPGRWRTTLAGVDDARLRRRPDPATWSPVEYAAHVRDVLEVLTDALEAMVARDHPTLGFPDPDRLAEERDYAAEDRDGVLDAIDARTDRLVAFLRSDPDWDRTASFPWGERDVRTTARNSVHEHVHHLWDVEQVLRVV